MGGVRWSMKDMRKRANEDGPKYSAICGTISIISEKPFIRLGKFEKSEIDRLRFYIVRNNTIVKDTTVSYEVESPDLYQLTEIPFAGFLKTDTIIVETGENTKLFYRISGFRHYAYLHYGMFGYVGGYECRFADYSYTVNGEQHFGNLHKEHGIKENILPKESNR